jgi:hypothetical protein
LIWLNEKKNNSLGSSYDQVGVPLTSEP